MSDEPIAHREDGSPIFDNAPSVVVLAVYTKNPSRLLVIQRATNPGYGLYALPGGYQMRGEGWQAAGIRELREETGVSLNAKDVKLITIISDSYGNNVIFGSIEASASELHRLKKSDEVLEIKLMDKYDLELSIGHWAFPTHALIANFMFGAFNA